MRRREFIAGLGSGLAWPAVARGQTSGRFPTIGFLGSTTPSAQRQWTDAFVQRMRELGWIEGRNIAIEYRWGEGRVQRFVEIAAEFVRLKTDIIITNATAPTLAAKQATSSIPIVFATAGDPVGNGLVASLARPGGNVTGLSAQTTDIASKRLEMLREVVPGLRRLAILVNPGSPNTILEIAEVQTAARTIGVDTIMFEMRRAEDIVPAFTALRDRAEALYVTPSPLAQTHGLRICILAAGARLPTMFAFREYVDLGGLMSYGTNFSDMWRRAGDLVDKILRGTKPADIPIEQPTKFNLVINLITAKAIGLTIPETFLVRANEVIE